jgi:hypothetical protein
MSFSNTFLTCSDKHTFQAFVHYQVLGGTTRDDLAAYPSSPRNPGGHLAQTSLTGTSTRPLLSLAVIDLCRYLC